MTECKWKIITLERDNIGCEIHLSHLQHRSRQDASLTPSFLIHRIEIMDIYLIGLLAKLDISESWSVMSDSLRSHEQHSSWNSPGQNTEVGSLSLLQGIFPTQGSNPGLLHCRQILYWLSHQGSPRILERLAYPFSRGSSWPRNQTGVSSICRRILYQLSYQRSTYINVWYIISTWNKVAFFFFFTKLEFNIF